MNLLKGLKTDTIEDLADLWRDKKFQKLVEILREKQKSYANYCLEKANNWDIIRELQWEATGYSKVIKMVEDSFRKVNKLSKKRRKRRKV